MNAAPSLDQLRDIHLPDGAANGPLEGSAIVLLALLGAAAVVTVIRLLKRRARLRPLRASLRELDALLQHHHRDADGPAFARGISRLLRDYAILRFPDQPVAGLAGASWLEFLDRHGGDGAFASGAGKALASLPYAPPGGSVAPLDARAMVELARRWLEHNTP